MNTDENPNDYQVGGDHYKQAKYQHWDLVLEFNIPYLQAVVIEKICRYRHKNGLEDLHKGRHYLHKLIHHVQNSFVEPYRETYLRNISCYIPELYIRRIGKVYNLNFAEQKLIKHVACPAGIPLVGSNLERLNVIMVLYDGVTKAAADQEVANKCKAKRQENAKQDKISSYQNSIDED